MSSRRNIDRVQGPCPFCHDRGGTIDCDFEKGTLLHSMPTCESYNRMSADEFVQAVINREHVS